jgi:hypothetical protein
MTTLSMFKDGSKAATVAASPIYLVPALSERNVMVFELLARDASGLSKHIGAAQLYALDGVAFWGRLEHLDEADPVHPTTIALRRPVMRGAIRRLSEVDEPGRPQ